MVYYTCLCLLICICWIILASLEWHKCGGWFFFFFFFSFACKLPWILTANIELRVLNYCVSIFYRHGCLAFISACLLRACHAHNAFRGQKKVSEPSELEFQMVAGIHLGAGTLLCHLFESSLTFNVARLDLSFSLMVPYRNECVFPVLKYSKIERVLHHFLSSLPLFNPSLTPSNQRPLSYWLLSSHRNICMCVYKYINITTWAYSCSLCTYSFKTDN